MLLSFYLQAADTLRDTATRATHLRVVGGGPVTAPGPKPRGARGDDGPRRQVTMLIVLGGEVART